MKTKPKPTESHWDEIDKRLCLTREPMGPEWLTTEQFAERMGRSVELARRLLKKDLRFESWRGTISATGSRGFKFRLKPKK